MSAGGTSAGSTTSSSGSPFTSSASPGKPAASAPPRAPLSPPPPARPRITLLALGVAQTGLLLALERPARRLLERGALWTTTVLINGMIMTVFLWHVTALVTTIGLIFVMRGWDSFFVLSIVPGTAAWWLARPLWIAVLVVALIPFIALFTRFERIGQARHGLAPPAWQVLLGCAFVCFGLSILTLRGIPTESWPGINLLALGLPFIGAALVWFNPRRARELGD